METTPASKKAWLTANEPPLFRVLPLGETGNAAAAGRGGSAIDSGYTEMYELLHDLFVVRKVQEKHSQTKLDCTQRRLYNSKKRTCLSKGNVSISCRG